MLSFLREIYDALFSSTEAPPTKARRKKKRRKKWDIHTAPMMPMPPAQRIAWLEDGDEITARRTAHGFTAGKKYPITVDTFTARRVEMRRRPGHCDEEVLATGDDLAILIADDAGELHSYTYLPPSANDEGRPEAQHHHTLPVLVNTFTIPEVPDVASLHPEQYAENKRRLLALERAA